MNYRLCCAAPADSTLARSQPPLRTTDTPRRHAISSCAWLIPLREAVEQNDVERLKAVEDAGRSGPHAREWNVRRRIAVRLYNRGRPGRFLVYPFFFFQAEDGIRDLIVTGVQTCALPISANHPVLDLQTGGGDAVVDARDLPIEPGQLALAEHVHEAGPALAVEGVGPCGVALPDRKSVV